MPPSRRSPGLRPSIIAKTAQALPGLLEGLKLLSQNEPDAPVRGRLRFKKLEPGTAATPTARAIHSQNRVSSGQRNSEMSTIT